VNIVLNGIVVTVFDAENFGKSCGEESKIGVRMNSYLHNFPVTFRNFEGLKPLIKDRRITI